MAWIVALLFGYVMSLGQSHAQSTVPPLNPIASLDVPRYLGSWYEVAKFPNRFQNMCVANIQAEYRKLESGHIEVINRCEKANGDIAQAIGKACQIGDEHSPKLSIIHQKIAVAKPQIEITFSDLLCDRKMVDALWSKFLDSPTTHRTLMDAANFLNVKQEVIYALVRSGILSVDQKTIGRRTSQWVAEEELARFSNHYVFARDLAKAMSTNPKSLSINLKVIGVMPVAGPGVDNCRQLLYRKADLVAANVPVTGVP